MDDNWVIELENKLEPIYPRESANLWARHSIYRVPSYISRINTEAYQPKMVSLGPYHHDQPRLKVMEEHKLRAVHYFLASNPSKTLRHYAAGLKSIVHQLMDCYELLEEKWRNEERFTQLMLIDGCFLLQMLITHENELPESFPGALIPSKDPLFGPHRMTYNFPIIRREMLLLENQIPLLVLVHLLAIQRDCQEEESEAEIVALVLKACNPKMLTSEKIYGLHCLEVFRKSLIQNSSSPLTPDNPQRRPIRLIRPAKYCFSWLQPRMASVVRYLSQSRVPPVADPNWPVELPNVRSATALREVGIIFRPSNTGSMTDIKFSKGVLSLPRMSVDDATESVLLNLMAYERMHDSIDQQLRCEVTSFVHFMGKFVDSAKDVGLLRQRGIINNSLGSDDEVVHLFGRLSKDVPLDPKCGLQKTYRELSAYCSRAWPKWVAYWRHNYFYKPWAFFSLCAALLLLVLAAAQVAYAALQYHS